MTDAGFARRPASIAVRSLAADDLPMAVTIHCQLAPVQFIARGGPVLLRGYYRAWLDADSPLAFGAFDSSGRLVGVLLGSLDPSSHYRQMLHRHGLQLSGRLLVAAVVRPRFGIELITTRVERYARAVLRNTFRRVTTRQGARSALPDVPPPSEQTSSTGEVTHVIVDARRLGTGAGRALMLAAAASARRSGTTRLELVVEPGSAAGSFYERLGWYADDPVISRSGEQFVRYRLDLGT